MKSILITGCNRGLGLGLVRHLIRSKNPPENIFATCRDAKKATQLTSLAEKSKNIHIIEMDLANVHNYDTIFNVVKEKVGNDGLNVLFNNAGISTKFTRIGLTKETQLLENFSINTVAPIMLVKTFLPLLKIASKNHSGETGMSVNKAAIVNMTSILGSISENDQGGYYPYRCSKAALNAATKTMAIDLKNDGILVTCIHPGWVRTDMGGQKAPMDVDTSVAKILNTLESLSEEHTGCFLQYDGKNLQW